ncbi:hypothetical protein H2200_005841 [Cladophialophora chaetospira]|uniref:Uncharacterized protein n=1 Tax=Cladophialophora chaetospira TaxID=386627 RepID=A0AA38X9U1_9EURO|nr:hypothetical protein H2200_005841 [Cladophialophora chaetospira]
MSTKGNMQEISTQEPGEAHVASRPEDVDTTDIDEALTGQMELVIRKAVDALNNNLHKIESHIENMQEAQRQVRNAIRTVQALRTDPPINATVRGQLLVQVIIQHSPRLDKGVRKRHADYEHLDKLLGLLERLELLANTNPNTSAQLEASEVSESLLKVGRARERFMNEQREIVKLQQDIMQFYQYQIDTIANIAGQNAAQSVPGTEDD